MNKLILLVIISLSVLIITSCDNNDTVNPPDPGSISLTSNPAGAQIWLDGTNTNLTTPDTLENVGEGSHNITLKLTDYTDTTFSVNVTAGEITVVSNIVLVSDIFTKLFGPIKIYETSGTTSAEPSGLDLSSGNAWGVTSDSSGLVDIYYSSSGYLVQSANLYSGLIRETDFHVGSGTNLFDGTDSPLNNTGLWTNNMSDTETNYVFLYDHDGHYSKLIIVNRGGGVPGEPAWVELQWYYNNTVLDNRF